MPSKPGSFIVISTIFAVKNIAEGIFQEVGKDVYKGLKYLVTRSTFIKKTKEDGKVKTIDVRHNNKSICKIEKKDFDKYITIKKDDSEGAENIKVHLDKALSIQDVKIKVDKTENINDIEKADEEENKYDNIKLSVSYEKKMTFKEIKEYLNPNDITNLRKKIKENIADKNKDDKKENNNKDYKNLFENTNN